MDEPRATILVVEDDRPTRTFLADNLTADGYEIAEAGSCAQALGVLASAVVDLAVLDLGLPDHDGLELMAEIRNAERTDRINPELPLLVLTGRSGELHRLRGFERGADDYLAKPFSYRELHARIGALLRRSAMRLGSSRLRVGPLEIDAVARQAWVAGERLRLSNKEFSLLYALAEDPVRVFTREELLHDVWGFVSLGTTRTLDSHACRLRTKLRALGAQYVVNVWGVGYRLTDGAAGA